VNAHIIMLKIDDTLMAELLRQAVGSDRKRQNYDLRTSASDTSQRMLNALLPGTMVPIHRHMDTTETVVCISGRLEEVLYEEEVSYEGASQSSSSDAVMKDARQMDAQDTLRHTTLVEKQRIMLCPFEGSYGCQIPKGAWHTVNALEPSVIFESKDGAFIPASPCDVMK